MKHSLIFFILYVGCTAATNAQTTDYDQLLNTYWNYRHRLRTDFMKVGPAPGHSLPAYKRDLGEQCGTTYGSIAFGDGVIDLGEYIATLATEYKLLREAHQDLTATTNELYYALRAMGRLDGFAEVFFAPDKPEAYDGFFVRSDVPSDMYRVINHNEAGPEGQVLSLDNYQPENPLLNFQHSPCTAGPIPANDPDQEGIVKVYNYIDKNTTVYSDCDFKRMNDGRPIEKMQDNEMSQDQVYGIIMGLYYVYKFVPADAGAQPNPDDGDEYINFHAYVKQLTHQIVSYCAAEKTVKDAYIPINDDLNPSKLQEVGELRTTWFIANKNNDHRQVWRGTQLWAFAYPISQIANEITGHVYDPRVVIKFPRLADKTKMVGKRILIVVSTGIVGAGIGGAYGSVVPGVGTTGGAATGGIAGVAVGFAAIATTEAVRAKLYYNPEQIWGYVKKVPLYFSDLNLANQMILKVAAMTTHVTTSEFNQMIAAVPLSEPFAMMRKTLHPTLYNPPSHLNLISSWEDKLSQIGCYGAGKTTHNKDNISTYLKKGEMFSLSSSTKPESAMHNGELCGIGSMLMHNMLRMNANPQNSTYRNTLCPCKSSALIQHFNYTGPNGSFKSFEMDEKPLISTIGGTHPVITPRKFSDYADIGIPKPFYVSHDVEVVREGELRVAGDLTVCGAELSVRQGGEISIPNTDPNYPTHMRVENGGHLTLNIGATLTIGDHSTLTIGQGGVMTIHRNTAIILDGPSAHLVIEGELKLGDYASLRILPGPNGLGYITFRKHKDPNTGEETLAKISPSLYNRIYLEGDDPNKKLLEIDGNFGVIVPENLISFTVKNGKIALGNLSRLNVACPTLLEDVRVHTINEDRSYYYFAGLITQGQPQVTLKNVHFRQGIYGLLAQNYYYPHHKPQLEQCSFESMITAIRVDGGGIDMTNVLAHDNSENLFAMGINTDCMFEDVYLTNCRENLFAGTSSGVLNWYHGAIERNYADGMAVMGTTFKPKCVEIRNNGRNGIYSRGTSYLAMSALSDAGYNTIDANRVGIYNYDYEGDLQGYGIGHGLGLDLLAGFNSFENNTKSLHAIVNTGSVTALNGRYFIETSENFWGKSTAPVQHQDYQTYWKPNWGSPLLTPNIEPYGRQLPSRNSFFLNQVGVCIPGMIDPNRGGRDDKVFSDEQYWMLSTSQSVVDVYQQANDQLFERQDYRSAMDMYRRILLNDYSRYAILPEEVSYIPYQAYKNYMMAYSKYKEQMKEENNGHNVVELTREVSELLHELFYESFNSHSVWSGFQLMLTLDIAECYRSEGNRQTAMMVYDWYLNQTDDEKTQELVNAYRCLVEGEEKILQGEITLEEKLADYSCDLPREVHPFYDALLEEESSYSSTIEESVHLNVYPNPTDGYVRVTFDPSVIDKYPSERAEIIITDSYGVPQFTYSGVTTYDGFSASFNYKHLPGVYYIKAYVGSDVYTSYVVLTK